MFRCKMDERRKFDNNNNNDNKAPAVNIDDGQHDRGEWGPWTGTWDKGTKGPGPCRRPLWHGGQELECGVHSMTSTVQIRRVLGCDVLG